MRESIASNAPGWASKHIKDVVMFPGQGFLVVVTLDPKTGEGIYRGNESIEEPWEIVFVSEDSVHYKSELMRQMDEEWGDPATDVASKYTARQQEAGFS